MKLLKVDVDTGVGVTSFVEPLVDAVRRVRARIGRGWAQSALAYDSAGRKVGPTSDDAVEWCLLGAMRAERVSGRMATKIRRLILREANAGCLFTSGYTSVARFNDDQSMGVVFSTIDRVITKLTGRAAP